MKRKLTWKFYNLSQPTPSEVIAIQTKTKALLAVICGTTWFQTNSTYAAIALIISAFIDYFITGFGYNSDK